MLSIQLNGHESPGILRAMLAALRAYAAEATEAYIEAEANRATEYGYGTVQGAQTNQQASHANMYKQTAAEAAPAAEQKADVASEVLPAEKPKRRTRAPAAEEVKPAVQEQPPTDNAHVAEGAEQFPEALQGETGGAGYGVMHAKTAEDAPQVTVVAIRAIAKKFNTDELRDVAMAILTKHAAASVTALEERDNIIRVSVMRDFEAAALEHNLA